MTKNLARRINNNYDKHMAKFSMAVAVSENALLIIILFYLCAINHISSVTTRTGCFCWNIQYNTNSVKNYISQYGQQTTAGLFFMGNDKINYAACAKACNDKADCNAFAFFTSSHVNSNWANGCYGRSSKTISGEPENSVISAHKYRCRECSCLSIKKDYSYMEGRLSAPKTQNRPYTFFLGDSLEDTSECLDMCLEEPYCDAYTAYFGSSAFKGGCYGVSKRNGTELIVQSRDDGYGGQRSDCCIDSPDEICKCFDIFYGNSTVSGLVTSASDENRPNTFYFGEYEVNDISECAIACLKATGCASFTLLYNNIPSSKWICMGRSDQYNTSVAAAAWSGTAFDCCAETKCADDTCEGFFNNAYCADSPGDGICLCKAGYTGWNCETNIDECASNPCLNNGTCTDLLLGYQCSCLSGYFAGAVCEVNLDPCISAPCLNSGTCTRQATIYTCVCSVEYTGDTCQYVATTTTTTTTTTTITPTTPITTQPTTGDFQQKFNGKTCSWNGEKTNKRIMHYILSVSTNIITMAACQEKCENHAECLSVSHIESENKCKLAYVTHNAAGEKYDSKTGWKYSDYNCAGDGRSFQHESFDQTCKWNTVVERSKMKGYNNQMDESADNKTIIECRQMCEGLSDCKSIAFKTTESNKCRLYKHNFTSKPSKVMSKEYWVYYDFTCTENENVNANSESEEETTMATITTGSDATTTTTEQPESTTYDFARDGMECTWNAKVIDKKIKNKNSGSYVVNVTEEECKLLCQSDENCESISIRDTRTTQCKKKTVNKLTSPDDYVNDTKYIYYDFSCDNNRKRSILYYKQKKYLEKQVDFDQPEADNGTIFDNTVAIPRDYTSCIQASKGLRQVHSKRQYCATLYSTPVQSDDVRLFCPTHTPSELPFKSTEEEKLVKKLMILANVTHIWTNMENKDLYRLQLQRSPNFLNSYATLYMRCMAFLQFQGETKLTPVSCNSHFPYICLTSTDTNANKVK